MSDPITLKPLSAGPGPYACVPLARLFSIARSASIPLSRSFVLATPIAMPAMPPPAAVVPRLSMPGVMVEVVRREFEYARFLPHCLSSLVVEIGGSPR